MGFRETLQKVYISRGGGAADYERRELCPRVARVVNHQRDGRGGDRGRGAVGALGDISAVVLCKTRVVEI